MISMKASFAAAALCPVLLLAGCATGSGTKLSRAEAMTIVDKQLAASGEAGTRVGGAEILDDNTVLVHVVSVEGYPLRDVKVDRMSGQAFDARTKKQMG